MKQASLAYRHEIEQPWRSGGWNLNLSIGLIREIFQASVFSEPLTPTWFLSENYENHLFDDTVIEQTVATFEHNVFRADGSQRFIDRNYIGTGIDYYGYISEDLSDENRLLDCRIKFKSKVGEKGLRGLTLGFDETYPTKFTIICNDENGSEVYRKQYQNEDELFYTFDVFSDVATEMILQIDEMNEPHVRFRLRYVLFGVGVRFTNTEILSSSGTLTSFMHPYSLELPTQELSMTIENYSGTFDLDNPDSPVNIASQGQEMTLQVDYVFEDGSVEHIEPTVLEVSEFSVDNSSMKINGTEFLRNETTQVLFDDDKFFTAETTLYDMAMKVKEGIQNIDFDVFIDSSLKEVPMKFNSIDTTVKEAFMMIASAGRCIMDIRGKGVYIRRTDLSFANPVVSSTDQSSFSDMRLSDFEAPTYLAVFEPDRATADGRFKFPTDEVNPDFKTGFISKALTDDNGDFAAPQLITITTDEAISPGQLNIQFYHTLPKQVEVKTYYNDEERETIVYDKVENFAFRELHDYVEFNKMEIRISGLKQTHSRLYISALTFERLPYEISDDIYESKRPTGTVLEQIRNIIVVYQTATKDAEGNIEQTDGRVTIKVNEKGADIEYANPFVTTEAVATEVGEWLKGYYKSAVEYDIAFMGDPTLEAYDLIKLDSKYNTMLLCDVQQHEINFSNGGIRGKIIGRRLENGMDKS